MSVVAASNTVSPGSSATPGPDKLDGELERFAATGVVSPETFALAAQDAGPAVLSQRLDGLSPSQRGALERELADKGLGGLLSDVTGSVVGGTIDTATGVVDVAADEAVETRSERQVDDAREANQEQRLSETLSQLSFDAVVAPSRRVVAPPVVLDWAASFPSPLGQPAPKVDAR
jgi:hypothetical protein